jgi:iron complex outermembrane receptor protein
MLLLVASLYAGTAYAQTVAAAPVAPPKSSADAEDAAADADDAQSAIVVTGQRQRGSVATEVPAEASISATAIRALGAADLDEVFQDLAPEITSGGDPTSKSAPAAVVLVNGQRIAGFSSVKDFPPEAIQRIEIFPEKVALQYGYGAGQRVVNIVLRAHYHALTLLGRDTLAPENWRGIYRAKLDLIKIDENSHWNIDLDYRHEDPIFAGTTLAGASAADADATNVPRHTFATQDDHLTTSGAMTRNFGGVSAELTGSLDLDAMQSRPGLSDDDGDLLASEGLSDLATGPLTRIDRTVEAQTNLTLNGRIDSWHWSFIGKLDDTTRVTRTDDAADVAGLATILLPSPGLLGHRCNADMDTDCVSTNLRTASGDAYLNGNLVDFPAGAVTASLRSGFVFSGIHSDSPLTPQAVVRNRTEGNAQANLDFPITTHASPVGKISAGINGELRQLSDFGTLSTIGSTLEWSPIEPVDILGTFSHQQDAPSLAQLADGALATPDLREFDFVQDNTAIVQRIDGGNADLQRQTTDLEKLRLQVNPLRSVNLQLSAEYMRQRTRDPIATLTAATAATMAAFPDRFTRTDDGYLTAMDVSPVNLDRRDQQQIRWGINYSTAFGAAHSDLNANGTPKPPVRNQFQIALYETWRLQDDVVLRDGQPKVNLLDGGIISDTGGTPAQQIELQTTVSTGAWSADINAVWQSNTTANSGLLANDRLTFSQGITLNLRLQINLTDQRWLTRRLPWLRGNLNLSADNILGAHTKVHDANGDVPLAFAQSYLNPTGRTFRITLRKRFR